MTTAIEYSLMADECFQWARAVKTKERALSLSRNSKGMA